MPETSLGIVVPAYRPDLDVLPAYLDALGETLDPAVIRVELDAPTDREHARLAETPATVAASPQRRGKGRAITQGFDALDTNLLAFVDADGATPAPELARIVARVDGGDADVAVGSRWHPDATIEGGRSPVRALLSGGFVRAATLLLDVSLSDYQCGAKALTADAWRQVRGDITERGFAWDIELLAFAGASDLRVVEVPIAWQDHPDSTVPPVRTTLDLAGTLVHTRYRTRPSEAGARSPLAEGVDSFSDGLATLLEGPHEGNE